MFKRLALSFVCGLFLLAAIIGPASAIIPAGVYAGTIIRGIIAGASTRAAIPAAGNAAKALSASGLFGVAASAYIVMCGQNYVSGNDCSGTPLAKFRPQGHTGADGETAAVPVAATSTTQPAATLWGVRTGSTGPGVYTRTGYTSADLSCMSITSNEGVRYAEGSVPGGYSWTYTHRDASNCVGTLVQPPYGDTPRNGGQVGSYTGCLDGSAPVGGQCTVYTCPAGWTLSGTMCNPGTSVWAADGVPSYRNQSGVWIGDPLDPDPYTPITSPVIDTTTTPEGQPMRVETIANADGSITVRTYTQGVVGGQTTTSVNEMRISASGTPTAVTNIYYGDVTSVVNQAPPTTQTPAPTPGTEIEIPDDYAREPTQQTIRDKIVAWWEDFTAANTAAETPKNTIGTEAGKQNDYHDSTKMGLPPTDGSPYDVQDATPSLNDLRDTISDGGDGGCSTYPLTIAPFGTMNINPCPLLDTLRPVMNWGFLTLCVITAVFIVLGHKPQEV